MSAEERFQFPFAAYPQQVELMQALYDCMDQAAVGCFESPTGTGKSLSTICASLTWLREEEKRILDDLQTSSVSSSASSGDWLQQYLQQSSAQKAANNNNSNKNNDKTQLKTHYDEILRRISASKAPKNMNTARIRHFQTASTAEVVQRSNGSKATVEEKVEEEEGEFLLKPYDSEDEKKSKTESLSSDDEDDFGDEKEQLWSRLQLPQIYYCSRTHTQLAQFVAEIKKTAFHDARCVILGSRKNLCINTAVNKLRSENSINEKCLELLQGKASGSQATSIATSGEVAKKKTTGKSSEKCAFHNQRNEASMSYKLLSAIQDMEDVVDMGHDLHSCPYYASRQAVQHAQVVCMPYSTLLHADVRESTGLQLSNKVVIVDEAHNLIEAINQLHSCDLTLSKLVAGIEIVKEYLQKFQVRLHSRNLYYINVLQAVMKKLKAYLEGKSRNKAVESTQSSSPHETVVFSVNTFLFSAQLDHINIFKLKKYLVASNMINRIGGFVEHAKAKQASLSTIPTNAAESKVGTQSSIIATSKQPAVRGYGKFAQQPSPPMPTSASSKIQNDNKVADKTVGNVDSEVFAKSVLRSVVSFITALTNSEGDGRVFVQRRAPSDNVHVDTGDVDSVAESSIKFVMLNPSTYFDPIIKEAKAVMLLGGTMQPFSYFTNTLLHAVPSSRMRTFSCGHIVASSHVKALVLGVGSTNQPLECTHDKRLSFSFTTEVFGIIRSLAEVIPHGIVVFFTSYQYLAAVVARWKSNGHYRQLEDKKAVFVESKTTSSEQLWEQYCKEATRSGGKGALLFSVIGGKLSEGINFSDSLARGVVVVGMPYPDTRDAVLQEKIKFTQEQETATSGSSSSFSLPESMCMKAVNQAIGRSIRHANDFASIVLVDHRYTQKRVQSQLPGWIKDSLQTCPNLATATAELRSFFANKQLQK